MREQTIAAATQGLFWGVAQFALCCDPEREGEEGAARAKARECMAAYLPEALRNLCSASSDADWERVALAAGLAGGSSEAKHRAPTGPLQSVLANLWAGAEQEDPACFVPVGKLAIEKERIARRKGEDVQDAPEAYARLWQDFSEQAQELMQVYQGPDADRLSYLRNLDELLQQFTWCVPSPVAETEDVSLYQQARMTAALAVCLAALPASEFEQVSRDPAGSDVVVASLVGGDISGVQDFIYTITSRGAASALRGRSLYLQLLTSAIVHYALTQLGLPPTNVIYEGGGGFSVLAPKASQDKLRAMRRYVSQVMLHHHGGDLYMALASADLEARDFFGGRFSEAQSRLADALRSRKERRFLELGDDMYGALFAPKGRGSEANVCHVCQAEHAACRLEGEGEEAVRKCAACLSYEEGLGDPLRTAKYLVLEEVEPAFDPDPTRVGHYQAAMRAFGLQVALPDQLPESVEGRTQILALDEASYARLRPIPQVAIGRAFLVNVTPRKEDGGIKTTDEMAESAEGIHRLGVLQMDVDDMGMMFSEGLGNDVSVARVATLSAAVSRYFEGYVEVLARKHNPPDGQQKVYAIYSGGDDLFFIGSWDAMVALALEIRSEFRAYVAGNPRVHLSGGMVLVPGKYPIYLAARNAHGAEQAAKDRTGKNAFTFLGQTLAWEEFDKVLDTCFCLLEMIEGDAAQRSLLTWLMGVQMRHDEASEERRRKGQDRTQDGQPQALLGMWIPRTEYMLRRLEERNRSGRDRIDHLREVLRRNGFEAYGWIGLAARWAQLSLRET